MITKLFSIFLILASLLWITYKFNKVKILKYISRYPWGVRIIKNEYFRTMFRREKKRVKTVKRAVEMAKLENKATNLKQYVIEVSKGHYWIGTMRMWNIEKKNYPKLKGIWPPRDSVFQTH